MHGKFTIESFSIFIAAIISGLIWLFVPGLSFCCGGFDGCVTTLLEADGTEGEGVVTEGVTSTADTDTGASTGVSLLELSGAAAPLSPL